MPASSANPSRTSATATMPTGADKEKLSVRNINAFFMGGLLIQPPTANRPHIAIGPTSNSVFSDRKSQSQWHLDQTYWAGGAFERLQDRIIVPLVLIAAIALISGGLLVRQREAQLIAEAERAIPGPLELHQPPR
jgi:hypothetical protein